MTDPEAEVHYSTITGYNKNDPSTDRGAVELDVLNYFTSNPRMIASMGSQLLKFINISHSSVQDVKYSVNKLGNAYLGVMLPENAMTYEPWVVDENAAILGGHAINVVGYDDPKKLFYIVSWGQVIPMTYDFFLKYCEEAWSLYSEFWIQSTNTHLGDFDHSGV
jgi:hypothetical protein